MELMNMTLGEFYEKAQEAVSDLTDVDNLSLQTFTKTAEADLKNAGLLEDPIFLRNGTIYFGIKGLYTDLDTDENADTDNTQNKFDIELFANHI